jgi:diguanylate cyclase (GGDEF)-like protein
VPFRILQRGSAHQRVDPDVHAASLAFLHARVPAVLAANLVNSSLLAWVFCDVIARPLVMSWYGLMLLTLVGRGAFWFRYRNLQQANWSRQWRVSAVIGSSVSGSLWGVAGVLFFVPYSAIHSILMAFVLGGMAAGALAILSAHPPTFRAYVLLSLVPFCVRLAAEGGAEHLAMAAMCLIYIIVLLVIGVQTQSALAQSFALRFENRALLRSLEQRVQDRTRRHATVVDFSHRALSGLDADSLLREAAAIVADGLPAQCAVVMEWLPASNVLAVRAAAGWQDGGVTHARLPANFGWPSGYALRTGEPTVSHDLRTEKRFEIPPLLRERGVVSTIAVAIWGDQSPFGVLEAWSTESWTIVADDVHFVRAVAATIAAAIQRRYAEEQAQRLALHDPLTGLPNRALFRDSLSQALSRANRAGGLLAVLLIDLDHFKDVNDTLGHPAGDRLLEEAAHRLRACVRKAEPPARLGGDEFAVVVTELERPDGAAVAAEKIARTLSEPFCLDGHVVHVGASIGITIYPTDGEDPDYLLRNADLALYRAKADGRNTYKFYSSEMALNVETRMGLLRDLRSAVVGNELNLVYQPQVALADGRITGAEALLRWESPARGLVLPDEFIPLAEVSGLIVSLGDWSIRRACAQAWDWSEAGLPKIIIAVNLSLAQLRRGNMAAAIERTLQDCRCDPACLELEITERAFPLPDENELLELIRRLRLRGISISIDDFGTGYSNLARLRQLPVNRIKVDRSFVAGLGQDANAEMIVRAIITLGRNLGVQVVAEGVELESQVNFLRSERCDFAQGYYLGPPVPAEAFAGLLRKSSKKRVVVGLEGQSVGR